MRFFPVTRRTFLVGLSLLVAGCVTTGSRAQQRFAFQTDGLGTRIGLVMWASDEVAAGLAWERMRERVAALEDVFSDWKKGSEAQRLTATAGTDTWVPVSDDLWAVLQASRALHEQSEGAFDVTVGPVVRLWRMARLRKELPDAVRMKKALEQTGMVAIEMDSKRQRVKLMHKGMRLDFGAIAKGYIGDQCRARLDAMGHRRVLVDIGGDLVAGEGPADRDSGWKVGVTPANDSQEMTPVFLRNRAIATSGKTIRFVEIDGTRYSHIVDPRTGDALTHAWQVTVLAPSGMVADGWASACSVLGPEKSRDLTQGLDDVDVIFR